ncbi:glycosyltransferase family 4 protein [Roseobacter sp. S98]|uniref:glycosyltransferase family 4 protein n=1 Tax=Roseobacter algicola (ex Choi et al. 2025) (nom. illeg.) TaxID=3092138 RepID=UPI0035C6A81B
MNILFVQTGDYAEAWHSLARGEPETYRDQQASVAYVAGLAPAHQVTTLCLGATACEETLAPGLAAVGMIRARTGPAEAGALLDRLRPDRLILRSPFRAVLTEAARRGIPVLPCFADLFQPGGLRRKVRHWQLRRALAQAQAPCVANHSLNASQSLVSVLGLSADRVVPWDWSPVTAEPDARQAVADPARPQLFYAGVLSADKGVGDCLSAVQLLHQRGIMAGMSLAGGGDLQHWQKEARRLGIAEHLRFLGLIPNTEVRARMAAHDAVIVPSRHSYPEGLPNTIYEALASRSPLILSDHPAFARRITPGQGGLVFAASEPQALADEVARLCTEEGLFARLSAAAPDTLRGLTIGLEWSALVDLFLQDPADDTGWVRQHALSGLTA